MNNIVKKIKKELKPIDSIARVLSTLVLSIILLVLACITSNTLLIYLL